MTLYWIRHGTSTASRNRCIGHLDVSLSSEGRQSMERLADSWTGALPEQVVSSDLSRAVSSAEVLAERWEVERAQTAQLRELDFGTWTGRSWDAIEDEDPERLQSWMTDWVETAPPNGEAFVDLTDRVDQWLEEGQATLSEDASMVVVAHGGPIRAVLCHAIGLPFDRAFRLQVDCAKVSTITRGQMGWRLVCLNADGFPSSGRE